MPRAGAGGIKRVTAVGAAVVEEERVGLAVAAQRADEEAEHVDLSLSVVRFEGDDVPRGVVHQRVNAQRAETCR